MGRIGEASGSSTRQVFACAPSNFFHPHHDRTVVLYSASSLPLKIAETVDGLTDRMSFHSIGLSLTSFR